jgi:hypothetical protein
MVFAMVQWSLRLLRAPLPPEGEPLLRRGLGGLEARRWGTAYALLWLAMLGAFYALFEALDDRHPGERAAALLAIAAAWIALNLLFVWFGRALVRVGERAAHPPTAAPAAPPARRAPAPAARTKAAPGSQPAAPAAGRPLEFLRTVAWIGGVAVLVALGRTLAPLRALEAYLKVHQRAFLIPLGALTILGGLLFLGGAIALMLAQGAPMTRQEIEELEGRRLRAGLGGVAGPAGMSWAAVRVPKMAVGAKADDAASFSEIKQAWQARAWEVSPRWRRFFLVMLGALLLFVGLFGIAIVLAPAGGKLLCAAALLYAGARTAWSFSRA